MTEQSFIDEVMGFNPQDLNAFHETKQKNVNERIYKTSPSDSKAEDKHYRSQVRVIYNPFDTRNSIVSSLRYSCKDTDGFFQVQSVLVNGDRSCPIFKAWKQLWFSKDEAKKEWAKKMFDRSESKWVLVQIIEDENHPEYKGQIKAMKLPSVIFNKMNAKMNPAPESKKQPVALMDYLFGPVLEMDVVPGPDDPQNPNRKFREINYDLCDFATEGTPIINVDGTQLFGDAELEIIDEYASHKAAMAKAKTQASKDKEAAEIAKLNDAIRECYSKAIKFLKENSFDLQKECGYIPWTEEETARVNAWIEKILKMEDPQITTVNEVVKAAAKSETESAETENQPNSPGPEDPFAQAMSEVDDDMPF